MKLVEHPCPFCEGQPVSPDCGVCGGSGTLPDATPVIRAALAAPHDPQVGLLREALEKYGEHQHEWVPTPTKRYENGAWRAAVEPEEGWDRMGVARICPDEETGECWCGLRAVLALAQVPAQEPPDVCPHCDHPGVQAFHGAQEEPLDVERLARGLATFGESTRHPDFVPWAEQVIRSHLRALGAVPDGEPSA